MPSAPKPRVPLPHTALVLAGLTLGACILPESGSAEIVDNSFFIEEAYNQERGVVQHIQTALWIWEGTGSGSWRSFSYSFTQEWPVAGQEHQLSYTVPYEHMALAGSSERGFGDVQVNYRYQAFMDDRSDFAFAPRLTVILPTGNEAKGLGSGTVGFQVNLPASKRLKHTHIHLNAGGTVVPRVRVDLPYGGQSVRSTLVGVNLGFSVIALLSSRLNLLFETASAMEQEIDEFGHSGETTRLLVSPGLRYGIDRKNGAQWVLGVAAPLRWTERQSDGGLFLYLSFEHPF